MTFDIYQVITDRIIAKLEEGLIPWHKPWTNKGGAISHTTGKPYSLLNQILLEGRAGEYITFKQCQQEGGSVRKGEKSHIIVFWKWLEKKDEQGNPVVDQDTGEIQKTPFLRYYNVFHIDQCDGITPHFAVPDDEASALQPDETAEAIITDYVTRSGVHLNIRESSEAFYRPSDDTVVIPQITQFQQLSEYYSTAFHELTHSTGHPKRLHRLTENAHFGSNTYSRQELVAQLGASFLVNYCGLQTDGSFCNNAAYIQNWLSVLKNDKKLLVIAAGKADKAVEMIIGTEEQI